MIAIYGEADIRRQTRLEEQQGKVWKEWQKRENGANGVKGRTKKWSGEQCERMIDAYTRCSVFTHTHFAALTFSFWTYAAWGSSLLRAVPISVHWLKQRRFANWTEHSDEAQDRKRGGKNGLFYDIAFLFEELHQIFFGENKNEGSSNAKGSLGVNLFFPPACSHVSALSQYSQSAKLWEAFVNTVHSFFGAMLSVVTMKHKQLLPHMAWRNDKLIC